jgi:hypothetical protein
VTDDGELGVAIKMWSKQILCPLESYPLIREFGNMLERLELGRLWNGREFFGYTTGGIGSEAGSFAFRRRRSGITISFAPEEWQSLRDAFRNAMASPSLEPFLVELSLAYGEI